jgi:hypothetical protein
MTDITDADREAAAQAAVLTEMREMIRAGRADHHAEPWARHREVAEATARKARDAEICAWLRETWMEDDAACVWDEIAASIDRGEV